jgi:SAM-dependent methyltransferase
MSDFVDPIDSFEGTAIRDAWAATADLTSEQVRQLTDILELRGAQPRQFKMRERCFRAAGIYEGMRVLELGCGSGVVTRHLSRIVGPQGQVIGIDIRDDFLQTARGLGGVEGGAPIVYEQGDAQDLNLMPSVDAVLAVTLLSHVPNPGQVVGDMVARSRPGVLFIALDQDYQTLLFAHDRPDLTDRIVRHGAQENVTHPFLGRLLPGMLVSAGFLDVKTWSFVYSERDANSYLMTIAERFAVLAKDDGLVSERESVSWLEHLRERGKKGTFFASLNYVSSFAVVPNG